MRGLQFDAPESQWRRIAHKIADVIYERLTGEPGYFDTRIAYIAETGPATRRVKRVALMDQDGNANRYLTDGSFLALTPALLAGRQPDRLHGLSRQPAADLHDRRRDRPRGRARRLSRA